jgi:AraC-like DNA-binding protein
MVSVGALRPVIQLLSKRGLDVEDWMARCGLSATLLCDADRRIPWTEIVRAWEVAELMTGERDLLARLIERVGEETIERPPSGDFAGEVRRILGSSLRDKTTPLLRLATAFDVSARTVQRRLARYGLRLRDLLDEVRYEQAVRYLSSTCAVSEIGCRLGFESPSSFHRWFGHWTGTTPAQYREQLRSGTRPGRKN